MYHRSYRLRSVTESIRSMHVRKAVYTHHEYSYTEVHGKKLSTRDCPCPALACVLSMIITQQSLNSHWLVTRYWKTLVPNYQRVGPGGVYMRLYRKQCTYIYWTYDEKVVLFHKSMLLSLETCFHLLREELQHSLHERSI